MVHEIFISYSREDKDIVFPFIKRINNVLGTECWIDLSGIESGKEFEEVIMQAIEECRIVLFMLSERSLKSSWIKREVLYAESEGKRVVPILIDGNELQGWFRFHFGNVDFVNINSSQQREKLINNLKIWLGREETKDKIEEEIKSKAENVGLSPGPLLTHNRHVLFFKSLWKRLHVIMRALIILVFLLLGADLSYHGWVCFAEWNSLRACHDLETDLYGFIKRGKIVIPLKWNEAYEFSCGLARVRDATGKYGFINEKGELVSPCQWKWADNYHEGLAVVVNFNKKCGFIDDTGTLVVPCQWRCAWSFSEERAKVMSSQGMIGFIDKAGTLVIQCQWEDATDFYDGIAEVREYSGSYRNIDKNGNYVN